MLLSLLPTVVALLTSLQMDLQQKFTMATACRSIPIGCVEVDHLYPILNAERTITKFGPTFTLTFKLTPTSTAKVFMPKRYSPAFSDGDIEDIRQERVSLHLRYEGTCPMNQYLTKYKNVLDAVGRMDTVLPEESRRLRAHEKPAVGRGLCFKMSD
jgi:hypothetical protein